MKSPAELDTVQWQSLTHAYGSAEDVPELIRALYQDDEETAGAALDGLLATIHHQGSVYPASAPAVPFLVHAARHVTGRREELLMLLSLLADHDPAERASPHWAGSAAGAVCAELCGELPELLPCLEDAGRGVRRAALRAVVSVAGLLPDELSASVIERVHALWTTDPVPAVRADALVALNRLGRPLEPVDSPLPEVRLAAAVLAAERTGPPYPAGLVEIIAADGAEPDPEGDGFPWRGAITPDEHLCHLVMRDADAGLAVAARWIAAGDADARGSWLAGEIAGAWRDREPAVLELLLAALPHQKDAGALSHCLGTIGRWIGLLPEPGAGLRDTLYRYAQGEPETAEPALLALIRARDARALDLVLDNPRAEAVEAAARSFPEAADRLIPVIRRELAAGAAGNAGIDLVAALAPLGAAARRAQPELADCLRTGRAAIVAARQLGLNGMATPGITSLLRTAALSSDSSLSAAAAVAHYRLTGEAGPALSTFEGLLSARGPVHWHLSSLEPLGRAAAPLLPLVEPLLTAGYEWTRTAAAEAHYWITGSPEPACSVLAAVAGPTPYGLRALRALAAIGRVPGELRPALRSFAGSPLRLLSAEPSAGQTRPDEELRTVARALLSLGRPGPTD
ncbi:hypothetical protein [Streptomyces aidingensis]|uniref:HEAT repeat-containing protein n=1 Tax=Streptomyces aidingensis TaxID=910347 RepID=A0A1I1SQZ9_9ACTN|nr:hypothetical protein [Streptomyces aidingensis]SFD48895.1 hypothetical protein SAMN05421773_1173 [Streptomyces aidingensis]